MKIVICSSYFLPHPGGVEHYVYQTARRLVKRGNKVWVITSKLHKMREKSTIEGINVVRIPVIELLPDQLTLQKVSIDSVFKKIGKIDAIITNTRFYPLSLAAGFYASSKKIPWLHIEHGTKQVDYSNSLVKWGSRLVDATMGKWILSHAFVAGISKASCQLARKLGARNCTVIHNGCDTKFFSKKKAKHKGISIVYVGRLIKEKGIQDLLRAAKGINAKVTIVGDGPYKSELKKIGGTFVGKKNLLQVRDILSKSDILVNPSYAEGLPTVILEAGAMGLPVIATDVGGTREVISNNKNGYLIKPKDVKTLKKHLNTLVKDAKLREKFGKALQKTVRSKFDWDEIVDKLEKVLRSL